MDHLKPPPELDFSTTGHTTLPERWRQWKETMQLFIELSMGRKTEKEKCSAFLYTIGQAGRDIYNTMNLSEDEQGKIDILFSKFETYCKPKQNVTIERYRFNTRVQGRQENVDQYLTELRLIARNCSFGDLEDQLIRDRLVCGTNSEEVRQRLLRVEELSLDKAVSICRAHEESKKSAQYLNDSGGAEVCDLKKKNGRSQKNLTNPQKARDSADQPMRHSCNNCGSQHPKKQCPAFGKQCRKCNKLNHFAKCCRSTRRKVESVAQSESNSQNNSQSDLMFVGAIDHNSKTEIGTDECHTTLEVEGHSVKFKVDTGSQVNILPQSIYKQLNVAFKPTKSNTRLTSYSGGDLKVKGHVCLRCQNKPTDFYIVETTQDPILGLSTSQQLGIIKIVLNIDSTGYFIEKHPKLFQGLGCLKTPYHIQIDPSVPPVVSPPRNQPAAIRERLKKTLDEMEATGVIRKVDEPTEWVNSLVVVEKPKSKKLRVCLDPRPLNTAIRREHYQLPTLEDITTRLTGAHVFSKLDANHGYWQIPLSKSSQLLTTFSSPFGRYCFRRMPFGIKSAQEVFQKRMSQLLGDLPGVETDIDDILVWGATQKEHDERLEAVLKRCGEINLTLNREKCQFRVREVSYIGHILNSNGVQPDPEKVRAIQDMPPPTDKKGVERLLGTINYLAKFIPNMSTVTFPIRELLKSDVTFSWSEPQEKAFKEIKQILSVAPVLAYFNVKKPVTITCDASQSGLGALLLQDNKPIAYASRALTDPETRYAQIEKELLAVVFAFKRFHQYVYGKEVKVESDHKPLESITKKPLSAAPPRLQRMLLQLQRYTFTLEYKPGTDMILADTLSRAYINACPDSDNLEEDLVCAINLLVNNLPVSDPKLEEIRNATAQDTTMMTLKGTIESGWPEKKSEVPQELRPYWNYRDEMNEACGIIFKGQKIVVPLTLRKEMLKIIHSSHLGMVKCKQRARDILFWPQMGKDIEEVISKCDICLECQSSNPKEPMISEKPATRPWESISTDLFKWDGDDYLLIVDSYSHFIEIAKLSNTTSQTVVMHTKSILARHGIPRTVKSDNGPQYTAEEYKKFSKEWKFNHVTTSPYHPQANGLAEKSVQIIKNLLTKAKMDNKDPYLSLLEYRNTSVYDLGSPAQLCMSRRLNSLLPCTPEQLAPQVIDSSRVVEVMKRKQLMSKEYYDQGTKQLSILKPNDAVRIQMQGRWVPGVIIRQAETPRSYIVKGPSGREYQRNRKHLRKVNESIPLPMDIDDTDENPTPPPVSTNHSGDSPMSTTIRTSGGRTIRTPRRYKDYVRH